MTVYINGVAQVGGDVGGLYGINVETLAGNKTLTPDADKIYQYLDPDGAHRDITLATAGATAGDRFVIRHNGAYTDTQYLKVKQAATTLDQIYAGGIREFVFDGTNWVAGRVGGGENDTKRQNIIIGYEARTYGGGVAIGSEADSFNSGVGIGISAKGYSSGVAVGSSAVGDTYGVAVGRYADGGNYGVALGSRTDTLRKKYSIALGYYSKCSRGGETSINIDGNSAQKNNVVQGRWSGTTTDNTPKEIFASDEPNVRFTIRPSSVLAFRMIITARDNVADEVAMYTVVDGLIKRDAAGNTTLVNCTVTTVHEDDAGWDAAVTADDGNEALIITVTGDAANPVQWVAVMDGVETHF